MMKADAVFEGGGIKGIGIVGALSYCESCSCFEWQRVAGTSVGAIIAALIAAGYTAKDLKRLTINTKYSDFLDKDSIQKVPVIGKALGFLKEKGMYSGDKFEEGMGKVLAEKGVYKFKDLMENGESRLKIVAADITQKRMLILPDDLRDYGIDPNEFSVALAVRMSISIPFYFKPVELTANGSTSYIVDGGVCCNFPITIFDVSDTPRWPTIGFKFQNPDISYTSRGRTDALSFMADIADTMTGDNKTVWDKPENLARTILIPTVGVESVEFNISDEKSIKLFKSGYRSAQEFIKNWNFEEYVKKYRASYEDQSLA